MSFRGNKTSFVPVFLVIGLVLFHGQGTTQRAEAASDSSKDGISYLINPGKGSKPKKKPSDSISSTDVPNSEKVESLDNEAAEEKAKKDLVDLVERANKNPENAVATSPEENKNGSFNQDDQISSQSTITFHINNDAICMKSRGNGKPDGANCDQWFDKDVSKHGEDGDSSLLERAVYQLWQGAKDKVSEQAYRIWNVAVRAGESLLNAVDGRLNIGALTKYELNEEATQKARELGYNSAEKAVKESVGDKLLKDGDIIAPPPEMLRTLAANTSRAIVNDAINKKAAIAAAKNGVEVIVNSENDAKKYQNQVNNPNNEAVGEERMMQQAQLDPETVGISLEDRIARAEALRKAPVEMVNPVFEGDKIKPGDPSKERYDEWAYRATVEQMKNTSAMATTTSRPEDFQISERQIASQLVAGSDSSDNNEEPKEKLLTVKDQINSYNRQLEGAARKMEMISAQSPSFVNNSGQIRSHKIAEGEMNVLEINELTPFQKRVLKKSGESVLTQQPSPKIEIPRTASELVVTTY